MIEINKCKLVPGITASWGDITGNIENQTDLVNYISTHGGGTAAWGSISGTLTDQTDLMDYMSRFATQSWVSSQGYLSSTALTGYATQSWVESQGYLTEHQDLTGYATESWVSSQGYLVSDDLSQYATRQWVTGRGYISSADLSGYATESWVSEQGYLSSTALSGYATQSFVTSAISSAQAVNVQYDSSLTTWEYDVLKRTNAASGGDIFTKQLMIGYVGSDGDIYDYIVVDGADLAYVHRDYEIDPETGEKYVVNEERGSYVHETTYETVPFVIDYAGRTDPGYEFSDLMMNLWKPCVIGSDDGDVNGIKLGYDGTDYYYGKYRYYLESTEYDEETGEDVNIYAEEYDPFVLGSDFNTLSGRVSALESNYGDAVTTTNNILGV